MCCRIWMAISGACPWTGFHRRPRRLPNECSHRFARRWILPFHRMESRSRSSPTVLATGIAGQAMPMDPGCVRCLRRRRCRFIRHGLADSRGYSRSIHRPPVRRNLDRQRQWRKAETAGHDARRSAGSFTWSGDGKRILVLYQRGGLAADLGGFGDGRNSGSGYAERSGTILRNPLTAGIFIPAAYCRRGSGVYDAWEASRQKAKNSSAKHCRLTGTVSGRLERGGIYFVDAHKTPAVLKFVDLVSRKVTVMASLPKPPAKLTRGLSISPDGRYHYCIARTTWTAMKSA